MAAHIEFQPTGGLAGTVTLAGDDGAFVIDDELWYQFQHLARAAAELAHGRAAAVSYWTQAGAYDLAVDGDEVVLTGDGGEAVHFRRRELVAAILAAADRWIASARASGDGEQATLADDVAAAVAAARAAMSS